ncbi:MAG: hypothetical protein JOZ54_18285 [Acidobacteria bacterium]|nr:hypothetical protein [Acidobacteriota bacterium]
MKKSIVLATLAIAGLSLAETPKVSTLYDRVGRRIAADLELAKALSAAPKELDEVKWMVGRWHILSRVFADGNREEHGESVTAFAIDGTWLKTEDSYQGKVADFGLLTFNPVSKQWIALGVDKTGNVVRAVGNGWKNGRLVLLAEDVEIVGERVTLRQTVEKRSDREYRILNEEKLTDGGWAVVDEYVYTRK